MSKRKRGLGRGLDALLSAGQEMAETASESSHLQEMPVEWLKPGKYQPRSIIDPDKLDELAQSIKAQGMVQPIVIRPAGGKDKYEIIAGERRWRAAQKAGLRQVPVVVRDVPDQVTVAMALIENIQREDLTPLEEAHALLRLLEEFELTHQEAADAVGRSRAAVSNLLRLLELDDRVQAMMRKKELDMGHARALLPLHSDDQYKVAQAVKQKKLSVRQTEAMVRKLMAGESLDEKKQTASDPDVDRLQNELSEKLATRVNLQQQSGGKGKLVIHYNSADELEGILERIR